MPMLVDKYKPRKLEDVVGQAEAVAKIRKWFDSYKPAGKALLLYGPPGTGKTSSIEALASQKCLDFIELNASDHRSAKAIRESVGKSVEQQSLFRRGKIFMIDEIDGVSGDSDRGGVGELVKLIEESKHPIIFTANDAWNKKLSSLRQNCTLVEFKKISPEDMEVHLSKIAALEKIQFDPGVLRKLSILSEGDMRAAINDTQSLRLGRTVKEGDLLKLGIRERGTDVQEALEKIFRATSMPDARRALDSVDKEPDEMMLWIETNLQYEMQRPEQLALAFDAISHADMFKARIRKNQNWRFLAYEIDMMTGAVVAAKEMCKDAPRAAGTKYQYPTLIAMMGRTIFQRAEEKPKLEALSAQLHCSVRKVRSEFLPFLRMAGIDF
jgi:replication factor C large subunit